MEDACKILLVDDVEMNLVILSEIITQMGHEPMCAISAAKAFEILKNDLPALILLDVSMPDMSGLEFCEILKNDVYTREIPVIFISAMDSQEDFSKAFELGAVDYIFKPFDPNNVKMRVNTHLKVYKMQQELEDANRKLSTVIKKQIDVSKMARKVFYTGIEQLLSTRDAKRTAYYGLESHMVRILTQAMQFSDKYEDVITESYIQDIEIASCFHDIGMISVPDSIVLNEQNITSSERKKLEEHVLIVDKYLNFSKIQETDINDEFAGILNDVVRCHHERFDGKGYPSGLKGEEIPLAGRIMAVIDAYDALVNERCYKKAMTQEEAMKILEDGAGTIYDPDIVAIFKKIQRQYKRIN